MNDPNGPIFWKGEYHVFYQYNPGAAKWGDMHWAHSASVDMIHWRHLPVALSPNPDGPDRDGCFSGSTVIDHGVPTILYTAVRSTTPEDATLRDGTHNFHESQCIAKSNDPQLRRWTVAPTPVITGPPAGLAVTGFRDPCLWQEGAWWYMAIGSGFAKKGGCVLLYRSQDLHAWEYLHPLVSGTWNGSTHNDPVDSGEMWECPDFFELDGKHMLLYSTERKVYWATGEFDRNALVFHPKRQGLLDTGAFYAPKSMLDQSGRRILWGWIPETRPESQFEMAGWAGSMALPRVLHIDSDGALRMEPLPELQTLRTRAQGAGQSFRSFRGEVTATISKPHGVGSIQIGPDDAPYLTVAYSASDTLKISVDGSEQVTAAAHDGSLFIQIFMDGSIIEVFVNRASAHTKRVYKLDLSSPVTKVSSTGEIHSLQVSELQAISPNRLTT
jgi:beta-fructofuranosidase